MVALLSCTFISFAHSQQPLFPRGCEAKGFAFQDNYLIMNESGRQSFFLIQNKSEDTIEMQRIETRQVFISPPLVVKIEPANWAAFASDVPNFHFRCYLKKEDNLSQTDCKQVLDICEYPRVRFALSNMGNYWVSSNKSQEQVINEAVAKGIYLKW